MSNIAQFYVKDANGNLIPAKFMSSPDGTGYVRDANNINDNPINTRNGQYYDANGVELPNFNLSNYLVVPIDFDINSLISFGQYVAALSASQQDAVMGTSMRAMGCTWFLR